MSKKGFDVVDHIKHVNPVNVGAGLTKMALQHSGSKKRCPKCGSWAEQDLTGTDVMGKACAGGATVGVLAATGGAAISSGAATGAAIGSVIPVFGTIIGGLIGGAIGAATAGGAAAAVGGAAGSIAGRVMDEIEETYECECGHRFS